MINLTIATAAASGNNLANSLDLYSTLASIASVVGPALIIGGVFFLKKKLFSNTSKVVEVDVTTVKQLPSTDIVGVDDISNRMFINDGQVVYTGVIETTGIAYSTLSNSEQDGINSGYVGFLNAINFPFSKHIMSKRIDIENTDNIYKDSYDLIIKTLDELSESINEIEKKISASGTLTTDEQYQLDKLVKRARILERDKTYILTQIQYLESVTTNIQGSTKKVYYSASGQLDDEAVKGLSDEMIIEAYGNNVADRMVAMSNSLSSVGVKCNMLNDLELLDLARTHYKPFSSTIYKTSHLINETTAEKDYVLNKEIFAKIKLHEALSKEAN